MSLKTNINQFVIKDETNGADEIFAINFESIDTIYDDEVYIVDTVNLSKEIAKSLIEQHDAYGWPDVEEGDFDCTFDGFFDELRKDVMFRVKKFLEEDNIEFTEIE